MSQGNNTTPDIYLKLIEEQSKQIQTLTQLTHSQTQSMAKLETQVGQLANQMSRREDGKLPSQAQSNQRGVHHIDDTPTHEQAKAVTTLRSGRQVDLTPNGSSSYETKSQYFEPSLEQKNENQQKNEKIEKTNQKNEENKEKEQKNEKIQKNEKK